MSTVISVPFNIKKICRLCLSEKDTMLSIFDAANSYSHKINSCAPFEVTMGDGLPSMICSYCANFVNYCYTFYQRCKCSNDLLHQYLANKQSCSFAETRKSTSQEAPVTAMKNGFAPLGSMSFQKDSHSKKPVGNTSKSKEKLNVFLNANTMGSISSPLLSISEANPSSFLDVQYKPFEHFMSYAQDTCNIKTEPLDVDQNNGPMDDPLAIRNIKVPPHEDSTEICEVSTNQANTFPTVHITKPESNANSGEDLAEPYHNANGLQMDGDSRTSAAWECLGNKFPTANDSIPFGPPTESVAQFCKAMKIKDGKVIFTCPDCGEIFSGKRLFNHHLKIHNPVKRKHHKYTKEFLCDICGQRQKNIKLHLLTHSESLVRPYLCNMCGKSFNTRSSLKYHLLTHTGTRNHICPVCKQGFYKKTTLKEHSQVHQTERPFKCVECECTFKTRRAIDRHMRTHTGAKPYKCQHCERCFSLSGNLSAHLRLHTGAKPYVCSVCEMAFTHNVSLRNHMKYHKPSPPQRETYTEYQTSSQ